MTLDKANIFIDSFAQVIGGIAPEYDGSKKLKAGVDLGTANICFAVLDENDNPVTGEVFPASVLKDGLVVDYSGSVAIVRTLKERIEKRLNQPIKYAAAAIPPGTVGKNALAVSNVIQSADIDVINVVDEPAAAATALNALEGAVIDIGGGTTGISIIRNGQVVDSYDEATGGSHMSLVIAGNYGISVEEAEKIKLNPANHKEIFPIIKPVVEKMASIVKGFVKNYDVDTLYIAGGASSFDGFEEIFEKECGIKALKPHHALLVTPLGIAMHCR